MNTDPTPITGQERGETNNHPSPVHHWTIICSCHECGNSETRQAIVFAGTEKCWLLDIYAIDQEGDLEKMAAEIERLRMVLQIIREAGQNEDITAGWMQRWAAWGMEPHNWPKPKDTPSIS